MTAEQRAIVVMPAYNAAQTLERTYRDILDGIVDKIILVDDVSHDETVEIARRLRLKSIVRIQNKGYGGNQKTCYLEALQDGADIVVMLHPDYQYDSTLAPELIAPIQRGEADMRMGSRFLRGRGRGRVPRCPRGRASVARPGSRRGGHRVQPAFHLDQQRDQQRRRRGLPGHADPVGRHPPGHRNTGRAFPLAC